VSSSSTEVQKVRVGEGVMVFRKVRVVVLYLESKNPRVCAGKQLKKYEEED
jgi:hypothetical protein